MPGGTSVYGELLRAAMQISASDISAPNIGLFYFNTTLGVPKWWNGSAWKIAADLDSTQTLAAKTLTAPSVTTSLSFLAQAQAKFYNAGSTKYVGFQAGTLSVDTNFTLPTADASGFLRSDGSGNLSFSTPSAGLPAANIRAGEGAGTTTLTSSDNFWQVFNLSAARTVVLPTTSISSGQQIILENRTLFDLTVQSSDLTTILSTNAATGSKGDATIRRGYVVLQATQTTPTAASHWRVVQVYEDYTVTGTSSNAAAVSFTFQLSRDNKKVTLRYTSNTAAGSTTPVIDTTAAVPSRFRPADGSTAARGPATVIRNSSLIPAIYSLSPSAGDLSFRTYDGTNYTGTCGLSDSTGNWNTLVWALD